VTGTSYEDTSVVNGTSYAYLIRTCPTQVSACVPATPAAGASVTYQEGSATVTADSGDHDAIADNCELATVQLNFVNDGNVPLDNVRLASVASSNPAVRIVSALPRLAGSLPVGSTVPVAFKFYIGRDGISASCGDPLTFTVTATSDQSPPSVRSFTLTAERSTVTGTLSYFFETDFSGWTTVAGSVTRGTPGEAGPAAMSLHFRTGLDDDCNGVISPVIKPTATSKLFIWVNYILQSGSYDRANVRAVDAATGEKFLLTPSFAAYNTGGDVDLLCDGLGHQPGWSGSFPYWQAASFDLSAFAILTFPTNVASVPSPSFSIWWHTEQVTPSAAALSPLGNVASGNRENTSVCRPLSRSAIRTAGIWHTEHSSSIACFDSG
jgi:hypothetical protein